MASIECEEHMQAWFPAQTQIKQKPLHETDIREIAQVLVRASSVSWSRIPRIYSVLKIIKQLEAIDCFVDEGITDIWFPFSQKSLPSSFQPQSARSAFLDTQHLVFNIKAIGLEQEHTRHSHFRDASAIPFKKIGELGQGGFGSVDRVLSTVTYKEYARKLLPRGKTFRKNKEVLHAFEQELSSLKRLSRHRHVVDFIGSYTDPKYVGIITSPVADCNLHDYLAQNLDDGQKSFLRTFFGCLTSALGFLHDSRIRHKDIKPQNILVKSEHVFLTDFGLALDWNEHSRNTTSGPAWQTPRYGAPEVAEGSARNESADIWSLGCVFLEMWTVLNGGKVKALHDHMINTGDKRSSYCANLLCVDSWIEHVKSLPGIPVDKVPAAWISNMLRRDRGTRWSARTLEERIYEHSNDPTAIFAFAGRCCLDDDDTEESVLSSADEASAGLIVQPPSRPPSRRLHHRRVSDRDEAVAVQTHSSNISKDRFEQLTTKLKVSSLSTTTLDKSVSSHEKVLKQGQSKAKDEGLLKPSSGLETDSRPFTDQSEISGNTHEHQRKLPLQPSVEEEELSLARELSIVDIGSPVPPLSAPEGGSDGTKPSSQWVFYSTGSKMQPQAESDVQGSCSGQARRRREVRSAFLSQRKLKKDLDNLKARQASYHKPKKDGHVGPDHMTQEIWEKNVKNSRDSHRHSENSSSESNEATVGLPTALFLPQIHREPDRASRREQRAEPDATGEDTDREGFFHMYRPRSKGKEGISPTPARTTSREYYEPSHSSRHGEVRPEPVPRRSYARLKERPSSSRDTDHGIPEVADRGERNLAFKRSAPSPAEIRIPSTPQPSIHQRFQTESSPQSYHRSERSPPRFPGLNRAAMMPVSLDSSASSRKSDSKYLHPSGRHKTMTSDFDTNSEREDHPIIPPTPPRKTKDSRSSNDGKEKRKKVRSRSNEATLLFSQANESVKPSQPPLRRTILREPEGARHRSPSPISSRRMGANRPGLHSAKTYRLSSHQPRPVRKERGQSSRMYSESPDSDYARERAAERQRDYSPHVYPRRYGPEDVRWAPRGEENDQIPIRRPVTSGSTSVF